MATGSLLKSRIAYFVSRMVLVCVLTVVHIVGYVVGANLGGANATLRRDVSSTAQAADELEADKAHSGEPVRADVETPSPMKDMERALRLLGSTLIVAFLNSLLLVVLADHTRLTWWSTTFFLWVAFFSCLTLLPQSEVLFFIRDPWPILRVTFMMGLLVTIPMSALAAALRYTPDYLLPANATSFPTDWISIRSLSLVLLYVLLYLLFGYFIAWQSPQVRVYYSGSEELLGFWEHMLSPPILHRVLPLQLARGFCWAMLLVFLTRNLIGTRSRLACVVASALAVWMNTQLLLPNPYMPSEIRLLHLIETASCNFVFGFLSLYILIPSHMGSNPAGPSPGPIAIE